MLKAGIQLYSFLMRLSGTGSPITSFGDDSHKQVFRDALLWALR